MYTKIIKLFFKIRVIWITITIYKMGCPISSKFRTLKIGLFGEVGEELDCEEEEDEDLMEEEDMDDEECE